MYYPDLTTYRYFEKERAPNTLNIGWLDAQHPFPIKMNDEISRQPLNAPGRYYVDSNTCVHHNCCVEIAPNNFQMGEHLTAYVFRQPGTPEEEAQCREALEVCPTAAIHDDGESPL